MHALQPAAVPSVTQFPVSQSSTLPFLSSPSPFPPPCTAQTIGRQRTRLRRFRHDPWGRRRARLELLPVKVEVRVEAHAQQQLAHALLHQLRAVSACRLELAAHPPQLALGIRVPAGREVCGAQRRWQRGGAEGGRGKQ